MIPLNQFELHNIHTDRGGLRVREGLAQHVLATTIGGVYSQFIGGFSLRSAQTAEAFHYLLVRSTRTTQSVLYVVNEAYSLVTSLALGRLPARVNLTYAVQNQQLLINAPEFPCPIYGLVGGGLKRAVKVASVNPDTQAIEPPVGLTSVFGDRIAIAQNNIIYFNDPGTEIRTYTGANAVALPSPIYDLFQGPGGGLYATTADGLYTIPADALGQGQLVYGMLSRVSDYSASDYRQTCATRGGVYGLTDRGVGSIGAQVETLPLTDYTGRRYWSRDVGPGAGSDFRTGTIWPTAAGFLVAVDGAVCRWDLSDGRPYWIYPNGTLDICGVLKGTHGTELWITPDRIIENIGTADYDGYTITGVACGRIPLDASGSTLVRAITTSADNPGWAQAVYVGGVAKSANTPAHTAADNLIGTDVWGVAGNYSATEMRSRRHLLSYRTDDLALEVAATGSGSLLGPVDITTKGKSTRRPTN